MNRVLFTFLTFIIANVFSVSLAHAATMHAILVADTFLGEYRFEPDIDCMKRELKRIASCIDYNLNALVFERYQVRIENVLQQVSQLEIEPDDMVVLFFHMHGTRGQDKQNPWPDLMFSLDQIAYGEKKGYFDFNAINEIVKNKNPRFMLSLAHSCNSYRNVEENKDNNGDDEEEDEGKERAADWIRKKIPNPLYEIVILSEEDQHFYKHNEVMVAAFRHLFLDKKGSIIISASSPGEEAIGISISGGVFTKHLLRLIEDSHLYMDIESDDDETEKVNGITWENILQEAVLNTQREVKFEFGPKRIFTPHYEINLN